MEAEWIRSSSIGGKSSSIKRKSSVLLLNKVKMEGEVLAERTSPHGSREGRAGLS